MNAGARRLLSLRCRAVLLLNNDAVLEDGCLARLRAALGGRAAVSPVVVRSSDGRVESRGATLDLRWGRFRLLGHGEAPRSQESVAPEPLLPGVALLVDREAFGRVGALDESFFHGFEDVDWCLRARAEGLDLGVVRDAFARHEGGQTLGPTSPDPLYYAVRNHLMVVERHQPHREPSRQLRRAFVVSLHLLHALRAGCVPRLRGLQAVLAGTGDFLRGVTGPRRAAS
jgi:GT2 family glycosyltransferase